MLDPELLEELARHPDRNAPEVNVALAEEGSARVLLDLAAYPGLDGRALAAIAARISGGDPALAVPDDDEPDDETRPRDAIHRLDRMLVAHPHAPDAVRDEVLARHAGEAFFVLAAASHARATLAALEAATAWPVRFPIFDRLWLALIPSPSLAPLQAEEWASDVDPLRREVVARLVEDRSLLERLAEDPARQVRRAVASNEHAGPLRARLAEHDPAPEVRRRAAGALTERHGRLSERVVDSARFAAALRSMETGGVLAPDVATALSDGAVLDEEGAVLAARALPRDKVASLVAQVCGENESAASERGVAAGLGLRAADQVVEDEEGLRALVGEAAKALSAASARYGHLTGKARLAAWVAQGMGSAETVSVGELLSALCAGPIGAERPILARALAVRADLLERLCEHAGDAAEVPAALLEAAWGEPRVPDAALVAMARKLGKPKRRGQDLPEDELDLDPLARPLETLEQVVLITSRTASFSPRTALSAVALDSRRVRYVMTALPHWKGRLSGMRLGVVLRQHAGALTVAQREHRKREADVRRWTERVMSDIELAVALGVGHITADEVVDRFRIGRHRLADGISLAAGAEARAAVEGAASILPLLRWATQERSHDAAALPVWLLLEAHDRARPATMIASAVDALSRNGDGVMQEISDALAIVERRAPGRLDQVYPQSPRGKAALASGVAKAYRALGGLRDEH